MTTVVLGFHEAVEATVVGSGKVVTELLGLSLQPFLKSLSDFLNLGVGKLCLFAVLLFEILTIVVSHLPSSFIPHILHHLGCGVVEGVDQQA